MPPRLAVRPFEPRDLDACAALLAARHRRDRARLPVLPARFESVEACRGELEPLTARPGASGFVAHLGTERSDQLAGYLIAERDMPAPDSFGAQWGPPRSMAVPPAGHAVAEGEDLDAAYGALYAAASDRWIDRGFFAHSVHITADPAVEEAWANLGFGRRVAYAVRDTSPVDRARIRPAEGVTIDRATTEDAASVHRFADEEARFHARPPIYWPYLTPDVIEARTKFHDNLLANEANAHFLARGPRGEDLAAYMFMHERFASPIVTPERSVYLFEAIVSPEARGSGVGSGLLDASLAWAREAGHEHCTLHFATANPLGRPFWLSHGFKPLEYGLRRDIDERMAWARPPE